MPVEIRTDALMRGLVEDWAVRRLERLATVFIQTVQDNAPRRTGDLVDSVRGNPVVVQPAQVTTTVEVEAEYGRYQDEGTGIYGPEGRPIRPTKPGGVLVFDWPAVGGIVFAREVRGTEPTRFWQKAVDAWPRMVAQVANGG